MTKLELINLTLKQLKESFSTHPECFHLDDPEVGSNNYGGPTIIWRYRVEVDGQYVQDPNQSARTIIVTFNKMNQTFRIDIYFREIGHFGQSLMADATTTAPLKYWLKLYPCYRDFQLIRKEIIKRKREKESMEFVKKLMNIFPTVGDDDLLG